MLNFIFNDKLTYFSLIIGYNVKLNVIFVFVFCASLIICVFVLCNFEYVSKKLYLWEHEKNILKSRGCQFESDMGLIRSEPIMVSR